MLPFNVIINDHITSICADKEFLLEKKKKVLAITNDFEEGEWRYTKFQNFIWDHVSQTALSATERDAYYASASSASSLHFAAKNLRLTEDSNDTNEGSEIAEIILYGIMKNHYDALPVVPKIFYKQNNNDYAKGADSVHIVIESHDSFSLWFGESKFYNSIADVRLGKIVTSVEAMLTPEKIKKENRIILGVSDLKTCISDENLFKKIKAMLDPEKSIDELKPLLNIPILLLHECEITSTASEYSDEYHGKLKKHLIERATVYFKKQIQALGKKVHKYSEIHFHLILFPVPSKKEIVDTFKLKANAHRA